MYQLQNFVQPCPKRDLARGALPLTEERKGKEGCGAAPVVGKAEAGMAFGQGLRGVTLLKSTQDSASSILQFFPEGQSHRWFR